MKPQLANDAVLSTLKYPVMVLAKVDGVRALNIDGTLTGRSLKTFEGFGITEYFSKSDFMGLDGEMVLGPDPASTERLCSLTTGAMGAFKGVTEMPDLHWFVFDDMTHPEDPYEMRYSRAKARVAKMNHPRVKVVPAFTVHNREQLDELISRFFSQGYEGAIIRNPRSPAKPGRPGKNTQEFVRVKPWADADMLVTGITEGNINNNEATVNELGRTERSSAKDGMTPNGMLGSIQGTLLDDFICPITGNILLAKGLKVTVSKGSMTQDEAKRYFENPDEIVNHIVKFNFMAHGIKDLPRFPGYVSHRLKEDM